MSELKACPFCGSEASLMQVKGAYVVIGCQCGMHNHGWDTRADAVEWWNTRAPAPLPPLAQEAVDALLALHDAWIEFGGMQRLAEYGHQSLSHCLDAASKLREAQG